MANTERIDEHLSILLPDGYVVRKKEGDDDKVSFEILYGLAHDENGDETSEIKFTIQPAAEGKELEEEQRNWKGAHHLTLKTLIHEQPTLFLTIKLLVCSAIIEYQKHAYVLAAYQPVSDRDELSAFADLAAQHMNVLLPAISIDGVPGEAEALDGRTLLRFGDLDETATEEEDKKEQERLAEAYKELAHNSGEPLAFVKAVHKDPITGKTKRDLFWERMGVESGDPEAMIQMGTAYLIGDGVDQDPVKAVEYYRMAAELDEPVGQYNMGVQCARGEGIQRDFAEAIRWMELAADNGDGDAPGQLKILKDAPEIEQKAYAGDAEAQARFSTILANFPSEENKKESFEMAQRSVKQGCPRGYYCLGTRYDYGMGVAKDPVKAAELYKTGAELGSPECQYCYAVCFKNGSGVPQNDAAALEWAIKAAEQGHCAAAASISMESGNQPQPIMPVERIIGYLLKAEEKEPGDVRVAAQLAVQYVNLNPSDFEKSIYWYDRAAELGDERASGMAHIYRYRQQLIDEGTLPEGIDAMDYLQFLQENDLMAEALGREPEKKEPQHDIDELLEGIEDEDPDAIKAYAFACFVEGEGVYDHGVDKVRAKTLLETLCETDPEAAGIMGLIEDDKDQAEKWLLKAAESGEAQFMKMLAQFYLDENEPFAEADKLDKALEWFEKSKEEDPEAEFYFDVLTYGKELFEEDELDEDASFFDILMQTHENAQDGDEAAEALTEKYSEIFDSFN